MTIGAWQGASSRRERQLILIGLSGAGIAVAGVSSSIAYIRHDSSEVQVAEPRDWIGVRLPLLPSIIIGEALDKGTWILVLYQRDCGKCERLIAKLNAEQKARVNKTAQRIALIEVPPYSNDSSRFPATMGSDAGSDAVVLGHLMEGAQSKWFIRTPIVLEIDQGLVARVSM